MNRTIVGPHSSSWGSGTDTEYTVDGPTYPQNGKTVTEHHDCRKV